MMRSKCRRMLPALVAVLALGAVASASADAAEEYKYSTQVKTAGTVPAALKAPGGVAVDSSGHVWVVDTENSRIDEFSSAGEYIKRFGTEGSGEGQLKKPRGIAVDVEGHVWVADTGNNRVVEFSSAGGFMKEFGSEGTETGKFKKPSAIAIDSSGNVWVSDTENNRVEEFSSAGTYLRETSSYLPKPEGIAADAKGDVWASASGDSEVVEFSATAEKIGFFGSTGKEAGEVKEAAGLVVSGEMVYVVSRGNDRVVQFKITKAETGKYHAEYVAQFGAKGSGNGQFSEPQGIALNGEGDVWVADSGNNRAEEFTP